MSILFLTFSNLNWMCKWCCVLLHIPHFTQSLLCGPCPFPHLFATSVWVVMILTPTNYCFSAGALYIYLQGKVRIWILSNSLRRAACPSPVYLHERLSLKFLGLFQIDLLKKYWYWNPIGLGLFITMNVEKRPKTFGARDSEMRPRVCNLKYCL